MKTIKILALVIFVSLTGCSSSYTLKNFSTKEKFYEDFNKSAGNKSLEIVLANDSTINSGEGAEILSDTLYYRGTITDNVNMSLSLQDIMDEYFTNLSHTSATLTLFNGTKLKATQIRATQDSIYFFITKDRLVNTGFSLIKDVRKVSYKNHWLGLPLPVIFGTIMGFAFGIPLGAVLSEQGHLNPNRPQDGTNSQNQAGVYSIFGMSAIGLVTGAIIGWINGYKYVYYFNP